MAADAMATDAMATASTSLDGPVTVQSTTTGASVMAASAGEPTVAVELTPARPRFSWFERFHKALVLPVVGLGVLLNGLGIAAGRDGSESRSIELVWLGIALIYLVAGGRLFNPRCDARDRLRDALALGVGLTLCRTVAEIRGFDQFDELLHIRTATDLMHSGVLFSHNPLLPASARYPGLELLTDAVAQLTGLSLTLSGAVVILFARTLTIWALFVLVERLSGSAYAAGVGVVVYCASPQYYLFNSQFSYQSLAIGLMFAVLALAVATRTPPPPPAPTRTATPTKAAAPPESLAQETRTDATTTDATTADGNTADGTAPGGIPADESPGDVPSAGRSKSVRPPAAVVVAPVLGLAALATSHHLTSWLAVGILALWTLSVRRFSRDPARAGWATWLFLPGLGAMVLWSVWSGPMIGEYLAPIFEDAFGQLAGVVGGSNSSRKLFSGNGGPVTPQWERGAIILWSLLWLGAILPLLRWFPRWRHQASDRYMFRILFALGLSYPCILVGRVSPKTAEFTTRFSTFIFIGLALVVGMLGARFMSAHPAKRTTAVVTLAAMLPFLGGIVLGSPDWQRSTGPYLVSADARSVDRFALQAARWARDNLPAGSVLACDRVNGAVFAARGGVWVTSGLSGGTNVGPLYFGPHFGRYEQGILARNKVDYLVVDQRLAKSLPRIGVYVAPGEAEPGTRITHEALAKYDRVPGSVRVYDNGPIRIYSVVGLWRGKPSIATPTTTAQR